MTVDRTRALVETHLQRGGELLARVDRHLQAGIADSSPEHLARGVELEACIEEHLGQWEEAIAIEHGIEERRRFELRLDSLRNERVLDEAAQMLVKRTRDFVRYFAGEGREHREALARIVIRLAREDALAPRRFTTAPSCRD